MVGMCIVCERNREGGRGELCHECAAKVSPADDSVIREHIWSTVTDAAAWLVDGFGRAHEIGERSSIGRDLDGQLIVLSKSMSREHAELRRSHGRWSVRDRGSTNGTCVDGVRVEGAVPLPPRALLAFGDMRFWFCDTITQRPCQHESLVTVEISELVRFCIKHANGELQLIVPNRNTTTPGEILWRTNETAAFAQRELPVLEFQLMRLLCMRAIAEVGSPAAVRGTIPTPQLARELPFQGTYPDDENVRKLVQRLRSTLVELGADNILRTAPGRGYYLACEVSR